MVRLGAMGDILHALPAVTALRKAHPEWVIDWVVEPMWSALLTAQPGTASRYVGEISEAAACGSRALRVQRASGDAIMFARETRHEIGALRRGAETGAL